MSARPPAPAAAPTPTAQQRAQSQSPQARDAAAVRQTLARQGRPATARVFIVVPMYNEQATLPAFFDALDQVAARAAAEQKAKLHYVLVNDGSTDTTLEVAVGLLAAREDAELLDLSRNFGKEAALSAGIAHALDCDADAVVPIDCDLQDPPQLIIEMLARWRDGHQVVLARRRDRSTDSRLKAWSAFAFYRLFNAISRQKIPEDVGDYRLMDRQVTQAVGHLTERGRMMKALMSWVGFEPYVLDYDRLARAQGETSFNAIGLLRLAMNGVLSFSAAPLRAILLLGLAAGLGAFIYGTFIGVRTLVFGIDLPGYASTLVSILLAAALQLTTLGIVGEYIARLFEEVKARPSYLIGHHITAQSARALVAGPNAEADTP